MMNLFLKQKFSFSFDVLQYHHCVQYLLYLKVKEKLAQSGPTSWYFGRIREFQRILWAHLGSLKFSTCLNRILVDIIIKGFLRILKIQFF